MATPLLELQRITKTFGPKVANDQISLSVMPGRIHALVGENGAGKTTLMTMIAGTARPDSGTISFDGKTVSITNPQKASKLGIGMVHQHFKLVPSLTVAANVFLGRELRTARGTLDVARMESEVADLSERFGLSIDPKATIDNLSVGLRQRVEVLKALSHDTRLLILDEPTAVLTPAEIDELFVVIRALAERGCAVLFISHKLGEVLSISDEITVIRDGRSIKTLPAASLSQGDIAQMMVGRAVLLRVEHTPASPKEPVLRVENLQAHDSRGIKVVDRLSLLVRSGEIVGVAGVEGNGQSELAAAVAGMHEIDGGSIHLGDEDVTKASIAARRKAGLAYIPEDRNYVGTAPSMSVSENLIATHLSPPITRWGWINGRSTVAFARRLISHFDVRGAGPATPIETLSGGNIQKVLIAREFESDPALLMVSQPTRGIDVGAMEFVHNAIVSQRDAGAAVLLLSADLNEVMSLSDRLVVMYRGAIIAEFTQETMSEAAVGLAMSGVSPTEEEIQKAKAAHDAAAAHVNSRKLDTTPPHEVIADPPSGSTDSQTDAADSPHAGAEDRGADETEADEHATQEETPQTDHYLVRRLQHIGKQVARGSVQPLVAIALSLAIGAIMILLLGQNPLHAYKELFFSNFDSPQGISSLIAQFIPLVVLTAGVIISFRAGFFNIGGEGQLYMGAFFGAFAGFTFTSLPPVLLTVVVLIFGLIGGMIWGAIPGALLAFWRVNIIVTTLMFSSIAVFLTAFLVTGPFKDPTAGLAASEKIVPEARFSMFSAPYGIGWDLAVALLVVLILGLVLTRTVWGLRVRQLGEMNQFAEYTGVSPKAMSIQVMALSGAVSGLAGAIFVLGPNGGRFLQTFSPGYGFLGITVALLARLNPWAAILAAAFYANMMAGSNAMQLNTAVPFPLVNVLQGLIILSITATFVLNRRTRTKLLAMVPFLRRTSGSSSGQNAVASDPTTGTRAHGKRAKAADTTGEARGDDPTVSTTADPPDKPDRQSDDHRLGE